MDDHMNTRHERVVEILSDHCTRELHAVDVEIIEDAQILHLYAARVDGDAEYLVHVDAGFVEEVLFDDWPPLRPEDGEAAAAESDATVSEEPHQSSREKTPMRIEKLMSTDVNYCRPEDSLESCARSMWENDLGSMPVCSGNGELRVVGMITDRDICMCALHEGQPLSSLQVGSAMSRSVSTCSPRDNNDKVEKLMRQQQVRRVPVTGSNGELLGIVSLADLARVADSGAGAQAKRNGISESAVGDTLAAIVRPPSARPADAPASRRG